MSDVMFWIIQGAIYAFWPLAYLGIGYGLVFLGFRIASEPWDDGAWILAGFYALLWPAVVVLLAVPVIAIGISRRKRLRQ